MVLHFVQPILHSRLCVFADMEPDAVVLSPDPFQSMVIGGVAPQMRIDIHVLHVLLPHKTKGSNSEHRQVTLSDVKDYYPSGSPPKRGGGCPCILVF